MSGRQMSGIDQIKARSVVDEATGCWVWKGAKNWKGYGKWSVRKPGGGYSDRQAHRVAWEKVHGPLDQSMTLDHLCRNRGCVNPEHLEPVTNKENHRRGAGQGGLLWDGVPSPNLRHPRGKVCPLCGSRSIEAAVTEKKVET